MSDTENYMVDISDVTGKEIDEPKEAWVTVSIEQGASLRIPQDILREDETVEEYVEDQLEYILDTLVREIADDGLSEGDISVKHIEEEDL